MCRVRRGQELVDVPGCEHDGELLFQLGKLHLLERVHAQAVALGQELEERPHRREVQALGRLGHAALGALEEVAAEVVRREVVPCRARHGLAEAGEREPVVGDGARRGVALDFEEAEEGVEMAVARRAFQGEHTLPEPRMF